MVDRGSTNPRGTRIWGWAIIAGELLRHSTPTCQAPEEVSPIPRSFPEQFVGEDAWWSVPDSTPHRSGPVAIDRVFTALQRSGWISGGSLYTVAS